MSLRGSRSIIGRAALQTADHEQGCAWARVASIRMSAQLATLPAENHGARETQLIGDYLSLCPRIHLCTSSTWAS